MCFVLCGPQGPQNVGAVARVMQNFGVYDLRIVNPGPFVLASDVASDVASDAVAAAAAAAPDGANGEGGVNSGAALGPDGLGTENLPPALRPTLDDTSDATSDAMSDATSDAAPRLCDEAYRFACAADWILADSTRHASVVDALDDVTFVMARPILTLVPVRPRSRCELHSLRTFSLEDGLYIPRARVSFLSAHATIGFNARSTYATPLN